MRHSRSPRIARVAGALGAAIVLASCAASQKSGGGLFGAAAPTPSPMPKTTASTTPRVYYARAEGLKVYSEPSTTSKVVGTLSLHEKVNRSKLERGYAFVESTKSDLKGWVDNAQLIWRLPASPSAGTPTDVEGEPEEPEAPAFEEPTPAAAPQPTPMEATVFPTMVPAPTAAPRELPTPRPLGPSIFNPY